MLKSLKHQTCLVHVVHSCFTFAEMPKANGVELCFFQASKFMQWDNSAREQVPTATWVLPDPSLVSHCSRPESRNQSFCASSMQQFLDKSFTHMFCVMPCYNSLSSSYNLLEKELCSLLGKGGQEHDFISAKSQIQFALAGRTVSSTDQLLEGQQSSPHSVVIPSPNPTCFHLSLAQSLTECTMKAKISCRRTN